MSFNGDFYANSSRIDFARSIARTTYFTRTRILGYYKYKYSGAQAVDLFMLLVLCLYFQLLVQAISSSPSTLKLPDQDRLSVTISKNGIGNWE
jgi:hypothetical protein